MKKKTITVSVICTVFILLVTIFTNDISPSKKPENTVREAIRIQYGWGAPWRLERLCTDEFIQTADINELILDRKIYSIEDNVRVDYQGTKAKVIVQVYCPDIIIHYYTLIQSEKGEYLISDIEYDT